MTPLWVITPTRGRPERFAAMVGRVHQTVNAPTVVLGIVDEDDPALETYQANAGPCRYQLLAARPGQSLSALTNLGAAHALDWHAGYLASMGDDHFPMSMLWDKLLIEAVDGRAGPGWAYGDDGHQGVRVPTAWVQSARLASALGWMMPPELEHMYVDNAVLELGRRTERIVYDRRVKITHRHPSAGGAAVWDETYRRTNTRAQMERDRAAFEAWKLDTLPAAAEIVTGLAYPRP